MVFPKEQHIHLHNFFVFFPLDLLILDKNMRIVEMKQNFKPFTIWNSTTKGNYLVELGLSSSYKVGDQLELIQHP